MTLQTPKNNISFIIELLKDISKAYENVIYGNQSVIPIDDLSGGANIIQIIKNKYLNTINAIDPLQDLTNDNIAIVLLNTSGTNTSTFINEKALQQILARQIHNLVQLSLNCVELLRSEMLNTFDAIDERCLSLLHKYPQLNEDVSS